jgi:aminomethyltransferase
LLEGAKIFSPRKEELGQSGLLQHVSYLTFGSYLSLAGVVTSGIPSPTLGKNIAMGYVKSGWHKKGTEVEVEVRKQLRKAVLTPMPFIKPNYWRG